MIFVASSSFKIFAMASKVHMLFMGLGRGRRKNDKEKKSVAILEASQKYHHSENEF